MANEQGTVELIAKELKDILLPIYEKIEDDQFIALLEQLGIKFPSTLANDNSVSNALSAIVTSVGHITDLTEQLVQAISDENTDTIIQKALEIIGQFKILIENVDILGNELQNAANTFGTVSNADIAAFFAELPTKLLEYTFLRYLETEHPVLQALLEFGGITVRIPRQIGSVDEHKPQFVERKLNLDNIPTLLNDPGQHFLDLYGWGGGALNVDLLLNRLANLLGQFDIPIHFQPPGGGQANKVLLLGPVRIIPRLDMNPNCLQIEISEEIDASDSINIPVNLTDWSITAFLEGRLQAGIELFLKPPATFEFSPLSGEAGFNTKLTFAGKKDDNSPFLLLGQAGGSRLQAREIIFSTGANLIYSSSSSTATGSGFIEAEVKDGKLVIGLSESDGFISNILQGINLESDFSFTVGVDSTAGFYFVGSSSLEIQLPVHIDLSIVEINGINLQLRPQSDAIDINLGSNLKFNLGPLKASIEDMGISSDFKFVSGQSGNLGPVDFGIGFKPPNGVGLSIDAGVVKGGGYLYFDFDREEYAGALELTFSEIVSLKAIGLITTKMPDGSKGFSLLIIITAEFGTGIQLGFGFTLLGVGGLLGLNRTMKLEPLAEGVRTGSVNNIMFPTNVVENAPQIISDLRKFFPPEEGTFLIGPMAKIGWGTPTLISLSLGIIIEIPGNIAILGVLKVALPTDEASLLVLQVNFIGAIEFDKDRLWFFASMFNSRVLFITIDGEMGLLMAWGNDANFVSSVGGFHPAFNPPPLPFPNPKRISLNILNESWGKVRVMGYFAVTSNTVQFGAKVEVYFGLSALNVDGHIGFDALFQFSPFYFIIQVSASFSVKVFGIGLFSVKVKMSLEGPTPWRAKGTGSISLLFFDIEVDFDFTWGEEENTSLPPIEVMPLLKAEYEKLENWKAVAPASSSLLVSLKLVEGTEQELVLHPVGSLQVSQRKAPLDITLDKVGTQKPSDANKFTLTTVGGSISKSEVLQEQFPLAQFQEMENAEKLSRPSFEKENSGAELVIDGEQTATGKAVKRIVRYEKIVIDTGYKSHLIRFFNYFGSLFRHFMAGNAVAKSAISFKTKKELSPFDERISVSQTGYAVASMTNNKAVNDIASFASEALAREYMNQQISKDPNLKSEIHVIPNHELNTAA